VRESSFFSRKKCIFATNKHYKFKDMDSKPLNRIKVVMAERMVSNKDLSEMLNKDTATISRWVTNTSQPTLESLIEIAKALKCDIGDLVRMDDSTILKNQD
jgi:DNA-binding Xre family transcriptional regulator